MGKCSVKGLALLLADFFPVDSSTVFGICGGEFFFLLRTLK